MDKLIEAGVVLVWLYIIFGVLAGVGVILFAIWFVPKFIRDWRRMDDDFEDLRSRTRRRSASRRRRRRDR